MDKPQYRKKPIGYIDSLAKVLHVDREQMVRLADKASTFYYLYERKQKADGSFRDIYGVKPGLKFLQNQIVKRIYSNVYFPHYLQGSIKARSTKTAAAFHENASLLVRMDISNFFPSLTSEVVFDIWKRFFNFPESVAGLLTKLTTFNGSLPQGAPTSPGLANLAFWDTEFAVVDGLYKEGFIYTRYVDDVIVSSTNFTAMYELEPVFRTIFGMFRNKGVKPNRSKIEISTSGHSMLVHNLNINSGVPTIPDAERGKIRSAVWECERSYSELNQSEQYEKMWQSALGKVNYLGQFHPSPAQSLRERLHAVQPVVSSNK